MIMDLAAAFPSVAISEATIDVYARELSDVPLALLKRSTSQALESCRFFPTVAELREKVDAMMSRTHQAPAYSCQKCFGSGWEQYRDDLNYNVARKCFH